MDKIQLIAYYLPQFYEIEFNNNYWGKGYTEWTATANAKPLFKGHYQPHIPADLGFYNLLMPETQVAQAEMAKKYGIDGFCYWHYWFGKGATIMEKPLENMLNNKEIDIPFCLAWANHSWHNPKTKEIILEYKDYGQQDAIQHFKYLLPAFLDKRYIKIDDKPVFILFAPPLIDNLDDFISLWNRLAIDAGFKGMYFIGSAQTTDRIREYRKTKLNAINTIHLEDFKYHRSFLKNVCKRWFMHYNIATYTEASEYFITQEESSEDVIPTIIAGWDHSPRTSGKGLILTGYTPKTFESHVKTALKVVSKKQNKMCFIKSWNEWGEGNHLEPDLKYGLAFLKTLNLVKQQYSQ